MKNLQILKILLLSLIVLSCSKDNDDNETLAAQDPAVAATINGGTYANYPFSLGVYSITTGTTSNTLSIDFADTSGNAINLFLNESGGFGPGVVKEIGNVDSNSFMTNAIIRDPQSQNTYFSSNGSITITNNRSHPTNAGHQLISGTFSFSASTLDNSNTATVTGSFTELDYEN